MTFLASGGDAEPAKGPGPASLQAASPPGEREAPVAAAAPPPSPEALAEDLLALFSAGDLGKKLYSVLCRDIATAGEDQPLCRTERLDARNKTRGDCWREIWGEARCAGGTLAPAANRQAPGRARTASRAVRARPRPLSGLRRRGEGAGHPGARGSGRRRRWGRLARALRGAHPGEAGRGASASGRRLSLKGKGAGTASRGRAVRRNAPRAGVARLLGLERSPCGERPSRASMKNPVV